MIDAARDLFGSYRWRVLSFFCLLIILIGMTTAWGVITALLAIVMMIGLAVFAIAYYWSYTALESTWISMGVDPETGESENDSWQEDILP